MRTRLSYSKGFNLIELVAVIIIVSIIGTVVLNKLTPTEAFQLQSSRDQVLAAFFSAQQLALAQDAQVQLSINASRQVDLRQDTDNDTSFADESSVYVGGTQYPITIPSNQSISTGTFTFDKLGQTASGSISLSQNSSSVSINVSGTGYAY